MTPEVDALVPESQPCALSVHHLPVTYKTLAFFKFFFFFYKHDIVVRELDRNPILL